MNFTTASLYPYLRKNMYLWLPSKIIPVFSSAINGDSITIFTTDDYGEVQALEGVYYIEEENLTISFSESFDDILPGAIGTTTTYLHRVSILGVRNFFNRNINKNLNLNYMNRESMNRLLMKIQID